MKKMENVADIYPLTPAQQGMLYHLLREPESDVYFEQISCTLQGALDVSRLQEAWRIVVDRHPALRTIFLWEGLDEPLQVVRQTVTIPWDILDWRDHPGDVEQRLDAFATAYRRTPFDLAQAPLLKMGLIRLAEDTHHFIWNFNHLLLDGWSSHQVFNEVTAVYEQLLLDQKPELPDVKPFRSYISWLQKQDVDATESFWRQHLAGFEAPTALNIDRPAPSTAAAFAEAWAEFPKDTTLALQDFARRHRITLNTILQGAWALLLSHYSGTDDLLYGTTVSGRPPNLPGVEQMVGMFINTLPLRVQLPPDQKLLPWLQEIQNLLLQQRQVEFTPLVKIQRWSDVPAGNDLFESIVVFENYPISKVKSRQSIQVQNKYYWEQSNYPLALLVLPGARLRLRLIYNSHRFEPDRLTRLLEHLQTILAEMIGRPEQLLSEITILTPAEQEQLLLTWNDTAVPITDERPLHEIITANAARTPGAAAVISATGRLTYSQLNSRANQLARLLGDSGLKPGTPVCLFTERSTAMIVGILGILKAGAAYLPLDPAYPSARVAAILQDSKSPVIVSQAHLAGHLPPHNAQIISLDDDYSTLDSWPDEEPRISVALDALAYIIYTSGSTGKPKGVMVTHHNLLTSTAARWHTYKEPVERFLLLSSFAFDSSVAGIFWTLSTGGTLVLPAPGEEKELHTLSARIEEEQITHTLTLPSLYELLLQFAPTDSLETLKVVIAAGEPCPPDLALLHNSRLPNCALYNEYGPTEATVWCTVHRLDPNAGSQTVPIGRPIANSQIYILDSKKRPVPVGLPGELYIGGSGVAAGYWNNPTFSAERFVTLTLPGMDDIEPIYRSGDIALWSPSGEIHFLGRIDDQLSIRGFRVEPGEIENVLAQHPGVKKIIILPAGDDPASSSAADQDDIIEKLEEMDPAEVERILQELL